jgi:flagellar FliL protein
MADEEKGQKPPKKGKGDKTEEAAEAKPKRKLPLKLIIIAVVALALLGGGGFFAWRHFSGAGGGHEGGAAESAEGEDGGGRQTLRLEQFIVNLIDPLGRRYLKVQIELEIDSLEAMEEAGKKNAQIRDSIITLLTSKSYADIESPEGKLQLRQEIISRVNQFLHKGKAVNAYFTDFVVQ